MTNINQEEATTENIRSVYDEAFYQYHIEASAQSAHHVLGFLYTHFRPLSVVDVGCGRGAWLKKCLELGSNQAVGYDGPWNKASQMLDSRINFKVVDLEKSLQSEKKFDLAMSLEVGEHLSPEVAERFVASLTSLSDVVLFSAAIPDQQGHSHVNERYQSYWGALFRSRGYQAYDLVRPSFWRNDDISPWYRQNCFLYVNEKSPLHKTFSDSGLPAISDLGFMDCVHPWFFERAMVTTRSLRHHCKDFVPSLIRAFRRRALGANI